MDCIEFDHISVRIGNTPILEDVCATIPCGVSTAIVGPNGAGKSTLILALLGQIPYTGNFRFPGKMPRFGFVPQRLQFDRDIPMTVADYLLAGVQRRPLFFGRSGFWMEKIRTLLDEVECSELENRKFGALSGGELQRIMLAQALLRDPEILIMDEPAAGMDFKGDHICCELLLKIRQTRKITQIMISHDLATVIAHASNVICLNHTVIAEGEPRNVLTHEVLAKTFGLHLGIPDLHDLPSNPLLCNPQTCPHAREHLHSHKPGCSCGHHHPEGAEK